MVVKYPLIVSTLLASAFVILLVSLYSAIYNNQPKTNIFCGGIAMIACPDGYSCRLEGTYPDAGGQCVKNIINFPKPSATPTLAVTIDNQKTLTDWKEYTRQDATNSNYKNFTVTNPSNWILRQDINQTYNTATVTLYKDNHKLIVSQPLGVGGGVCLFPDMSNLAKEIYKSPSNGNINFVTSYKSLIADSRQYRYYENKLLENSTPDQKTFTFCQQKDGDYSTLTDWGSIYFEVPNKYSTPIFKEMLEIVKSLSNYSCPTTEWINCMPSPDSRPNPQCQPEFLKWAQINCPDFKGAAL